MDVLSIVQRGDSPEYERLVVRLDSLDDDVAVPIVSFEEQMRGWLAFIARAQSSAQQTRASAKLHALLDDFSSRPIPDYDQDCAAQFELLVRSKIRIGAMDLKIAATAITRNATLLSRNLVDFRKVPGLRLEDWSG
jgi:tRNA(fMet)-specific endonuclease VapC